MNAEGVMSRLCRSILMVGALIGSLVLMPGSATAEGDDLLPVVAQAETAPNFDDDAGGLADADDPAIWVHPSSPTHSLVVGTLKNGGLTVFDLRGRELQHIPTPPAPAPDTEAGRFNNVDILQNVRIGDLTLDIAVVSDRGRDRLRIYSIDPRGAPAGSQALTEVTTSAPALVFSADEAAVEDQRTAYGLALRADPAGGAPWVVVSQRHETQLGLFRLGADPTGRIEYQRAGQIQLPATFHVAGEAWTPCAEPGELPQVEGMVVDQVSDVLYAAQEDVGVWQISLSSAGFGQPVLVERVREYGQPAVFDEQTEECVPTGPPSDEAGEHLSADAEGLAIAYRDGSSRTLLASSQGDSTFAAYQIRRTGLRHVGGFRVIDGAATDSVEHSDGAAVTTAALGARFPQGLLVVHDGENTPVVLDDNGEPRSNTNFKLLRLEQLARIVGA
jgi:3-phytase